MKLLNCVVLIVVLSIPFPNEAYRILGVFPFNGLSHFVMFDRLMKELATRGHQIDVIGHHPLKKPFPNYTDIINLSGDSLILVNNLTYEFATNTLGDGSLVYSVATQFGGDLCDLMDQPKFREFIKNPPQDPPYDLVIVEIFGANCYLALGQHLKAPVVGIDTSPMWPWANGMVANPDNPSYMTHIFSDITGKMDFWQRIKNTLTLWIAKWQFSYYSAYQDNKIKKYIGPDAPSLKEAENNVSLILVNSHYSLHGVRPFTTAVVEVGGLHIKENGTSLPTDLQKWLDDSTSGFLYISFGSMLKIETYPKKLLIALYSSLRKLDPIRVLIKVANKNELPPGLPNNTLTLPWIPQSAVLQHKNIRAFMTHGGLMGTQEAVYHGVPMIGVPIFSDQSLNIEFYVKKKIAVALNPNELTEENLDAAFEAILHDPSYIKSIKRLSAEFRDRPMTAVDTAIFWIEYVIRHGGANLRSPAMDLAWWQIALIDVYGVIITAVALAIYLIAILISKIKHLVFGNNAKKTSKRASKTRKNK